MNIDSRTAEQEAVRQVAQWMCVAARTAPKARGIDEIDTRMLTGEDLAPLADTMEQIGRDTRQQYFVRDAGNVRGSLAVVLVGVRPVPRNTETCGFCGFPDCAACVQAGGSCAIAVSDLGIAVGSAAAVAADARVDNRVFFTAGVAALRLGLMGEGVTVAYGIPLAVRGKSIFFDR